MEQIITSPLDNDLYKFSMLYFVWKNAPNAIVKYRFTCRNKDIKLGFLSEAVKREISAMFDLRFSNEDIDYLKKLRYLSNNYTDFSFFEFLKEYRMGNYLNKISVWEENGDLMCEIEGKWISTILYEVPVLAIINELYYRSITESNAYLNCPIKYEEIGQRNLNEKIELILKNPYFKFSEFGTRRRFSKKWQDFVVGELSKNCKNNLVGTSNLFLARKYNQTPIGTMAHELFSGYLGIVDRIEMAQRTVLYLWMATFDTKSGPDLGIALSDTFTVDAFLRDFNRGIAAAYDGTRHDSNDPYLYTEKMIKHYNSVNIDPVTKSVIWSNSLTIPEGIALCNHFHGRISDRSGCGIGTSVTNDVGFKPLNIVMKLVECNGRPCVKISDDPPKAIGDADMIEKVKKAYGVK